MGLGSSSDKVHVTYVNGKSRVELPVDPYLVTKHDYEFPDELKSVWDHAAFSQLVASIFEISETYDMVPVMRESKKLGRHRFWCKFTLMVSGIIGFFTTVLAVVLRGYKPLMAFAVLVVGVFFLGVLKWFHIQRQQEKCGERKKDILAKRLVPKLNVMNRQVKKQMIFTYYNGMLVIEFKVESVQLQSDLFYVSNDTKFDPNETEEEEEEIAEESPLVVPIAPPLQPQEEVVMVTLADGRRVAAKVLGTVEPGSHEVNDVQPDEMQKEGENATFQ